MTLDHAGLENMAEELAKHPDPVWNEHYHFHGEIELTLRYFLVLDALNFCFWPPPGFPRRHQNENQSISPEKWGVSGPEGERLTGYYALSYALRKVAEENPRFFEAGRLATLSEAEVGEVLGEIPLLSWRVRAAQEVGRVLLRFKSGENFFSLPRGSAPQLVEMITAHLPMFRDATVYDGLWVPFYKRAQILVADIWGSFAGKGPGAFQGVSWLTAFADYKLPQILWAFGALRPCPALAERIRKGALIPWGSTEEVELRAATVVAVEELTKLLSRYGREMLPFQVDWLLWNAAQRELPVPHHRTLTWAY